MDRLRHARHLARLVLVALLCSLGVAMAAPLVAPKAVQLVCSGSGVQVVPADGADGTPVAGRATLDCPLCLPLGAPPPSLVAERRPPLAPALLPATDRGPAPLTRDHVPGQPRAPPPSRA